MQDIDDTVIPGSVYLVDVQERSTVVHADKDSSIVLSPTPSNNVNDPLNWTKRRKTIEMICVMICAFTFVFELFPRAPLSHASICTRY